MSASQPDPAAMAAERAQVALEFGRPVPGQPDPAATGLDGFEVYRSGAQFSLACRKCSKRCGSWRTISLPDLNAAAGRHVPACPARAARTTAARAGELA